MPDQKRQQLLEELEALRLHVEKMCAEDQAPRQDQASATNNSPSENTSATAPQVAAS